MLHGSRDLVRFVLFCWNKLWLVTKLIYTDSIQQLMCLSPASFHQHFPLMYCAILAKSQSVCILQLALKNIKPKSFNYAKKENSFLSYGYLAQIDFTRGGYDQNIYFKGMTAYLQIPSCTKNNSSLSLEMLKILLLNQTRETMAETNRQAEDDE